MKTPSANETWYSLYAFIRTILETGQEKAEISSPFLKSLIATDDQYVEGASRLGLILQELPDYLKKFDYLPGQIEGKPLLELLETYNKESFLKNIRQTNVEDIKNANDIKDGISNLYAQAATEGEPILKQEGEGKTKEKPSASKGDKITIKRPDGTVITLGGGDSSPSDAKKGDGNGDDPRDIGKPKLYGEEIDPIIGKCGISIHKIECIEDEYTEDDVIYSVRTQQEFKDFDIIVVNFVSDLHEDIDEGEILSAFDTVRKLTDTTETRLKLYDEDRCCLRYYGRANVDGKISKYVENTQGFNLDKFKRCVVDVTLMDGSTTFFEYLSKILEFLTLIGAVGFDIFQISSVNQLVNKVTGFTNKNSITQLKEWFEELLDESKTNLGSVKLIVSHDEFKAKIESGNLTVAQGKGFSWIEGVSGSLTGHPDADYKVTLRYESFK